MTKKDYSTDVDGDDEMPFDVEQQSYSTPIPITPETRIDSSGLPIPPPPSGPSEIKHQATQEAKRVDMTPPRSKLSSTPGTPQTATMYMQEHDEEEIVFSNDKDGTKEDDTSDISGTFVFERESSFNYPEWSLATKFAAAGMSLVLVLAILLVCFYVSLDASGNTVKSSSNVDAATELPDWPSARPSHSPTEAPSEIFLTLTPTRGPTPSPNAFAGTSSPTQALNLGTPPPTLKPTVATPNPTPPPTLKPAAATPNPTPRPTLKPTVATPNPTPPPTARGGAQSPSNSFNGIITDFLFDNNNDSSVDPTNPAVQKAIQWLVDEATAAKSMVVPLDEKYRQRFGILILYFTVGPNHVEAGLPNVEMRNRDECTWIGMHCDASGIVSKIKMTNLHLDGRLPAEWGFFPNLKSLDLSKNKLQGSIPEGLYDMLGLEEIYLYKNRLTGTISSKIGDLWSLKNFHVSQNQLVGSIPSELGSTPNKIRQIRYFNVHRNQLTGSIPSNMRLRQLYYLDLGRNQFSSTLPPDLGTESVRLRHLHLDHNQLEGTFPSEVLNAGEGRLRTLILNDNKFTGTFPGDHRYNDTVVEMTIQNNDFVSMQRNTCNLDVWSGGELVEFKSDCLVCRCGFGLMCQHCQL